MESDADDAVGRISRLSMHDSVVTEEAIAVDKSVSQEDLAEKASKVREQARLRMRKLRSNRKSDAANSPANALCGSTMSAVMREDAMELSDQTSRQLVASKEPPTDKQAVLREQTRLRMQKLRKNRKSNDSASPTTAANDGASSVGMNADLAEGSDQESNRRTPSKDLDKAAIVREQSRVRMQNHRRKRNTDAVGFVEGTIVSEGVHIGSGEQLPTKRTRPSTGIVSTPAVVGGTTRRQRKSVFRRCMQTKAPALHHLGFLNVACSTTWSVGGNIVACGALHWSAELKDGDGMFSNCCGKGKYRFEHPPVYPADLRDLMNHDHSLSTSFHKDIRRHNSSVQFVSLCAQQKLIHGPGVCSYRIQGKVYTSFNRALLPDTENERSYGQLFLLDTEAAVERRKQHRANEGINIDVSRLIDKVLRNVNPFVQAYKTMFEVIEERRLQLEAEQRSLGNMELVPAPELRMVFRGRDQGDPLNYTAPRSNEVAAVFLTTADGEIPPPQIMVHERGKDIRSVPYIDPMLEPMAFPLFYPHGTPGFTEGIPLVSPISGRTDVSRREYVCWRMAVREGRFNPLHRGGKLFQEWLVTSFVFLEGDRMQWFRDHQEEVKAELYNVQAFLRDEAKIQNATIGRSIVLPSSHHGSPRFWKSNFEDAMTIVRKYGVPDLFITLTCNPKWEEIGDAIKWAKADGSIQAGYSTDRPDIVARVFDMKKSALLDEVRDKRCFGALVAWIYVIEFQLRGLPHLHMIATLDQRDKFREDLSAIDACVQAQIPDADSDPVLFDLVKKHHIHGPDCKNNQYAMCKNDRGLCRWDFPQPFNPTTTITDEGRVRYARPDNGRTYNVGTTRKPVLATNRDIASYCPYLLKRFNCHVYVELVFGSHAVKYLYKYCYKGYDRTKLEISVDPVTKQTQLIYDETKHHVDARVVSAPEATWRLLGKPLQRKSHSVVVLPVHTSEQQIAFKFDYLKAYFMLNARGTVSNAKGKTIDPRNLYYSEVPEHFFEEKGKWTIRVRNTPVVARLANVSPRQIEAYHLRILLLHIKGATS